MSLVPLDNVWLFSSALLEHKIQFYLEVLLKKKKEKILGIVSALVTSLLITGLHLTVLASIFLFPH
jgi:hypothetical protein